MQAAMVFGQIYSSS